MQSDDAMTQGSDGALRLREGSGRPTIEHIREVPERVVGREKAAFPRKALGFFFLVIVPFIVALVYFAGFATDQYASEARFAVRSMAAASSNDEEKGSSAGMLSLSSATQDAYVITSFIHSSDMLDRLGQVLDYRAMFDRQDADPWSRISRDAPREDFLTYWREHVSAYIDGPSGIVTLRVRAFDPEDARALAQAILDESEKLINELSTRARTDIIEQAAAEVDRGSKQYSAALTQMTKFQQESALLNPQTQAAQDGGLLTGLLAQKLDIEARLYVMREANTVDSPVYSQLEVAVRGLDAQIATLRNSLTGEEDASVAQSMVQFARLETDRQVAQALYEASRRSYDEAVAQAMRKALYVMVFVHPAAGQEPSYPNRTMTPLMILLGCFAVWATLSLAWASVEDHRL